MKWQKPDGQGSFRGALFYTRRGGAEIGRRIALHVYPMRDLPWAEDLGRKARKFDCEIFVCGPDYQADRNRLIKEFETPGPGSLVHPYYGTRRVVVLHVRGPRQSTRRDGMATFSVTFVEAGEALFPSGAVDTAAEVNDQADNGLDQAADDFVESFGCDGQPGWVVEAAQSRIELITTALDDLRLAIPGVPDTVTSFISDLQVLSSTVSDLIRRPADLAWQVLDLIGDLGRLVDGPVNALQSYRVLRDLFSSDDEESGATPSRAVKVTNDKALTSLVRRGALVETARSCAAINYDSYTDAMAIRDEVAALLDNEMVQAADDMYTSLADLRVAIIRDISARGADLATLAAFTPRATMPALLAAHIIYGDGLRDGDIISRNHIRHPGFVSGGNELEYLING